MDIDAYIKRIGYSGSLKPDYETLRALHTAHLLHVPFENLSIHWGEPIILEQDWLYEKIVLRRRGGFCYELNGLFACLLEALGFQVARLSAGVAKSPSRFGPDFDHLVLMVTAGERWLVDVGFGDSFLTPLLLETQSTQDGGRNDCQYKIVPGNPYTRLWNDQENGAWKPSFRFRLEPFQLVDFADRNLYHQTSPESSFTQQRICSMAAQEGRIMLSERWEQHGHKSLYLKTTHGQEQHEVEVDGEEEFNKVLFEVFGIRAP